MRLCTCPVGTALPTLDNYSCPADFGQVRRFAIMRIYDADGNRNSFTSAAPIGTLASWTAKIAKTDSEKVVISPDVYGYSESGGDVITWGSGNEVPGGMPEVVGANPVTASGTFRHLPQSMVKKMLPLACEKIGIIPISENGQFEAVKGETEGTYYPIPVGSFFIGPKVHGGFQEPDSNAFSFTLAPDWSKDTEIVTPSFDALTELVNPTA